MLNALMEISISVKDIEAAAKWPISLSRITVRASSLTTYVLKDNVSERHNMHRNDSNRNSGP